MDGASAGMVIANEFEPSPEDMEKPSCALDPNGILRQAWMMEKAED
jgi:hypothetical protein